MPFNFDLAPQRRGTNCSKWDDVAASLGIAPGDDLLPLSVADMDFFCAPEILDAVRGAIAPGALGYRHFSPRFGQAVAGWMQRRHGLTVQPEAVISLPGVVPGIAAAIAAFTQPGDGVIVQIPAYPPFMNVTRDMGRTLRENRLIEHEQDGVLTYEIDFDQLRALAAEPNTRLMVLCSPHNPTGRCYSREEIAQISAICAEHDVFLVSDEIHSDLVRRGVRFVPALAVTGENTRVCQLGSPSKSFNTAGTHAAYMIIPDPEARAAVRRVFSSMHLPTSSFVSEEVVTTAYGPAAYYPDELCAYLDGNIAFFTETMHAALPGIRMTHPDGTYLVWADFRGCGVPADRIYRLLCEKARVIPTPGDSFDPQATGYLRINLAMPRAMLKEATTRIIKAIRDFNE